MATVTAANTNLEYFDGFDDYSASQIGRYWQALSVYPPTISAGNGRNATAAIVTTLGGSAGGYLGLTLASQATRTIGFAIKIASVLPAGVAAFADASTKQVELFINADGTLTVKNGGGTALGTSTFALSATVWYYVEFSATINNSTGSFTVRVNGTSVLSASSVNTRNTSNNSANAAWLGVTTNSGNNANFLAYFDDFYCRADSTFCGDVRVESVLPSGNGGTIQWTPLTGSNYTEVHDNPSDDDTSYNYAAAAGVEDLYTYPAIPSTSGTVYAVMSVPVLRNDSAGTVTATSVYHVSGTDYAGGTQTIGSTSYNAYPDIQGTNPATSSAWTVSAVNAASFGINRTA